jgi:hypothetical protein
MVLNLCEMFETQMASGIWFCTIRSLTLFKITQADIVDET